MKKLLSLLFAIALFSNIFAQLTASNDTTICAGQQVQLNVTGGTTYTWTPSNTLSSSTSANPIATPPVGTTTYVVSSPLSNANIVVNGSFAQGNTGFTSSYQYEVPVNTLGSGSYFVGGSAPHWNPNMSNCSDRNTDVDSNMLIANGALTANTPVWCQTLPVNPNTTYNLSAYIQELHNQNYPKVQWTVNGVNAGNATQAIFFVCFWTQAQATWNSGINTSATFCIVDPTIAGNGNDFALDEISITGSGTMTDTVRVTVLPAPVVSLGNDTSLCTGQTLTLNAGNSGATYLWSDNTTAQTLAVNGVGTYAVTVTNGTCSATVAVNVYSLDITVTTASVNTTCGLNNGEASVTPSNGTSPFTYLWSNSGNTDTITSLAGATYTVTVNDAAGCSATGSSVVNTSGAGNITITAAQNQICATDSAEICAPTGYTTYLWNNGAATECIHPSLAGNYYLTVTDNANCSSTSNHVAVSVYPVPSVSVSVNGDTLNAFNAVAYQWYFNGNQIINAYTSTYIATQSGSYTVQVTDSNGCTALSNPLAITTGIEEFGIQHSAFSIYPNPNATGNWQLAVSNDLVGKEIEVTDVTGKSIWKSEIGNQKSEIRLSVASGVYMLKISSGKNTYLKKLVKL